jgi:hypothetical protein
MQPGHVYLGRFLLLGFAKYDGIIDPNASMCI